jgi:hypothetical protein
LCITSTRRLEILQPLLGDGQLLHLPLRQLPLPCRQSGLLVPQTILPGVSIKLASQDLDTGVLQTFTLPVKLGLASVEARLTGTQSLELAAVLLVVLPFEILVHHAHLSQRTVICLLSILLVVEKHSIRVFI